MWLGGASATVITKTRCVLVPVDERSFIDLVTRRPEFALQVMRVLVPKHPAPGVPHNFLYVLQENPPDDLREKCEQAVRQTVALAERVRTLRFHGLGIGSVTRSNSFAS